MKREKLFDAITEIRDDLILQAEKRRKRPFKWIAPVAAAAAIVLVLTAIFYPGGNPAVLAIAEAEYPIITPRPEFEDYEEFEEFLQADSAWLEQYSAFVRPLPNETAAPLQPFFTQTIQQLLSDAGKENRACSPLNLYMALGLLAEVTDGAAHQQILKLLNAQDRTALREQVSSIWKAIYCNDTSKSILANSIWLRDDLSYHRDTLTTLAENHYTSSYQGKMGSAAFNQALQNWLNSQTDDLLQEQVGQIEMNPDTVLVLASTVCYSAKWYDEFDAQNTKEQTFHAAGGDIRCPFLRESYRQKDYFWSDQFSATYKTFDNGTMLFLLPDEGVSIDQLLQDEKALAFMAGDYAAVESKYMKVSLSLPKFDISSQLELTDELKQLGITEVFSQNADFSPLTNAPTSLSEVQHGTRIAIDEEGCVAAAYTVVKGEGSAMPPEEKIHFSLDRPFLFAILGDDNLPLFAGIVNQP